jgi:hypothetical protein
VNGIYERTGSNTGHGHVRPRPDGVRVRCGDHGVCKECSQEKTLLMIALAKSDDGAKAMPDSVSANSVSRATPIVDVAIYTACNYDGEGCDYLTPDYDCRGCPFEEATKAALRSACPKEPPAEWIEAMAPILVYFECDERTVWRAQPLWQELWGEDGVV